MASMKLAFASVLDTVSRSAIAVTKTVDTVTNAVGMADAFVTKAAQHQDMQYRVDKQDFIEDLIADSAKARAEKEITINDFRRTSEEHDELYVKAYGRYAGLFQKELSVNNPQTA